MFRPVCGLMTTILAAALSLPALAQTTAKDVSKKTGEAVDTLKSYTVDKKNDAVAYGKKMLRDRIIFGSGYPTLPLDSALAEIDELPLDEETQAALGPDKPDVVGSLVEMMLARRQVEVGARVIDRASQTEQSLLDIIA